MKEELKHLSMHTIVKIAIRLKYVKRKFEVIVKLIPVISTG